MTSLNWKQGQIAVPSADIRPAPKLGLVANWQQFALLVLVNGFVGAMVGAERLLLPLLAVHDFGLTSRVAILSFLVTFGLVKAGANLFAGRWSDRVGRKHMLLAGWLAGLPIPILIYFAPTWSWIVSANVLLGINQGLAWSTTVIMKIDLVGPRRRGLAMGLNEASGYLAVSLSALCAGYLSAIYGARMAMLGIGESVAITGLCVSAFFIHESRTHAEVEAREHGDTTDAKSFKEIFLLTSWRNRTLFSVSFAGMVNNLNDGTAWGLFPLYFASRGLSIQKVSVLVALYPAVWGFGQLGTGALSDRIGRKVLIVWGMVLQGFAIILLTLVTGFVGWAFASVFLGIGTAMVYPTFLAAIGDIAHPSWRGSAVGVYRLWRDSGYAIGAILAGILADAFGTRQAIAAVGGLTVFTGLLVALVMRETLVHRNSPINSLLSVIGAKRHSS